MQNTLNKAFCLTGISLHRGEVVNLKALPAPANSGVWFRRIDIVDRDPFIEAIYSCVTDTRLCTRIANQDGISVQTIEHLMAALAGTGIHNALIEIDGPELPILDGSSKEFVNAILSVGKKASAADIEGFKIEKTVKVTDGLSWATLAPADEFTIEFYIDYSDTVIGRQNLSLAMKNGTFVRELCDSRTFCRQSEVSALKSKGLVKGGTLKNAVVLESDKIVNIGGLRRKDECVRHKMLDAMGDLSLAGRPLLAAFTSNCGGHALTNRLLRKTFADSDSFVPFKISKNQAVQLPGFGLQESDLCRLV